MRMLEGKAHNTDVISREHFDCVNHLVGNGRRMLNFSFDTVSTLAETGP